MPERHKLIPASYLVLMKDKKILLLRRFNTGYRDGEYSFIAGHVEADETFRQAIVREAKEEAGIVVDGDKLVMAHAMQRSRAGNDADRVDLFFTVTEWQGEVTNMEPQKCDDLSWFSLDALPDNIIPYIRQVIDCIKSGKVYSESGFDLLDQD